MYKQMEAIRTFEDISDPGDLSNNKLHIADRSFHDWYRFVLSYPPQLVRTYIDEFQLDEASTILDPFCGTGTTVVEAKKNGISAVGIEAIPMAFFASKVKTRWEVDPYPVEQTAQRIFDQAGEILSRWGKLKAFSSEQNEIILKDSINELPLHKCLVLYDVINQVTDIIVKEFCLLALAHVCVFSASNLKFGPEVGISPKKKTDAPVLEDWLSKMQLMANDLKSVQDCSYPLTTILNVDSRDLSKLTYAFDAVITSPPYPNEKDYTRTTRLESTLLGFLKNKIDLRMLKKNILRSNTRNVYVDDNDDKLIATGSRVDRIAQEIERRRKALNKTSGFERLYHRVTRLYFGGMKRHLSSLRPLLRPGAKLAYVVGDQASYLQVHIPTGELLADIANELGFAVRGIDLFRTRISTATGKQLREEVLLLEWKGNNNSKGDIIMTGEKKDRYEQLIKKVFFKNYKPGANEVFFDREEFAHIAEELGIKLPKNLGDILYSYRYRNELPKEIRKLLKPGQEWVIRSIGRGKYQFLKSTANRITPNPRLSRIKILDATPEIIRRYALNDEQALLAILRYNRLIDIFLGITCCSLQNHLRTTAPGLGQAETDEIYIGVSKNGEQFVIPVQAKGKKDQIGITQIEQDLAICKHKFPILTCRPMAAQFIEDDLIALFELERSDDEITIKEEKHYRIVPNEHLTDKEIDSYRQL